MLHLCLLTIRSHGEAKGRTIYMNGSQEAKALPASANNSMKRRSFNKKPVIEVNTL